jgi:hypothetical protein
LPCAYDKKKEKYEKETGSHHAKILAKVLSALISPAMPARITRADYRRAGRANYLAPFQTATNSRGLANFLVWFVLAVIQTDPMLLNGCYVRLQRVSAQFVSMAGNGGGGGGVDVMLYSSISDRCETSSESHTRKRNLSMAVRPPFFWASRVAYRFPTGEA